MIKVSLRQAEEMVRFIPVTDRDRWLQVAFGLKTEFGDQAFRVWEEWSRGSPQYNPKHAKPTWKYIKQREGGVTIATIIKLAKDGGWKPDDKENKPTPMSAEERKRIEDERKRKIESEKKEQERIWKWAANKAKRIITVCQTGPHPYFEKKGFPEQKGLVIRRTTLLGILTPKPDAEPLPDGDPLVIPLRNRKKAVTTLQQIYPGGEKRFLPGGRFGESAHSLGTRSLNDVWLCEGYATGLSTLEALRLNYREQSRVVVCFSANNLIKVARHFKRARIIADHDEAGIKAAKETGHPYWKPPYEGTDANDYHLKHGIQALTKSLMVWIAKGV